MKASSLRSFSLLLSAFALTSHLIGCGNEDKHMPVNAEATGGPLAKSTAGADLSLYSNIQPVLAKNCTGCHHKFDNGDRELFLKLADGGMDSKVYQYVVLKTPKEMPLPGSPQSQGMSAEERRILGCFVMLNAQAKRQKIDTSFGIDKCTSDSGLVTAGKDNPAEVKSKPKDTANDLFEALPQDLKTTIQSCQACHGPHGTSPIAGTPHLAGLQTEYIVKQLNDFATGSRKSATMEPIAKAIPETLRPRLAQFFNQFEVRSQEAKLAMKSDNMPRHLLDLYNNTCVACHNNRDGHAMPRLLGQNKTYLIQQLKAFKSGERTNFPAMNALVAQLSEVDIAILADYLSQQAQKRITE